MTPYLTCEAAIERLDAFVDGELTVDEQVAVESHLRWCRVCEARVADMRLIGGSMRLVGQAAASSSDRRDLAVIQSDVLTRLRAERDQSWAAQLSNLFVDMRLLWPALGATAAVITCVFTAAGVFAAATAEENSRSLAAMIEMLAHPGSDRNPLSLDLRISAPRALDASLVLDSITEDDAVYAVSAVVTTDGRVSNYELLMSERDRVRRHGETSDVETVAFLDAVKRSRFEPAQLPAGSPVAVNVVWLVERTTVKGTPTALVIPQPRPLAAPAPAIAVEEPVEIDEALPPSQSGAPDASPSA
ncbi:MAG: anti-sigma factor [Vicinamibacterales bacterium]